MVRGFVGHYINLDRSLDRRERLERHLAGLGVAGSYVRFAAIEGDAAEAARLGLQSAGEAGIWRSMLALLAAISAAPQGTVHHVVEDDAVVHPALFRLLGLGAIHSALQRHDMLLTEMLVEADTHALIGGMIARNGLGTGGERRVAVFDARWLYRAGMVSLLVAPRGAGRLLRALDAQFVHRRPLVPIDLALRGAVRSGRVGASITLPFVTTIDPAQDRQTTIHDADRDRARQRELCTLLRRTLYLGATDGDVAALAGPMRRGMSWQERQAAARSGFLAQAAALPPI